ncbi:uncharacterized protein [Rutidosis leptorrhynchoides]|uniref:uncharacterized protein n=1 Tax=Rutidosis leptorrhynchoides TaxID=125765 RepID=UPI003A99F9A9
MTEEEEQSQQTSYPEEPKKKWYVIFDGPSKGIYNNWATANQFILGRSVTHKSYKTLEAAKVAFNEAYKTIATQPANEAKRLGSGMVNLNHYLYGQTASLNAMNRMKNILSTTEKEDKKKPSTHSFQRLWDNLVNYNKNYATMMFYPKNRKTSPKAVFLPEASPLTISEYFVHGLIDTLYIDGRTLHEIKELPQRMQEAITRYRDNFAKEREIFLRMHSSYPIFNEDQQLLVPSITIAYLGVSNGNYPTRDEALKTTPTIDHLVSSLAGVYFGSSKIGNGQEQQENVRINYVHKNVLIYSSTIEKIDEKGLSLINNFEEPFEAFTGQLSGLPEDIKRRLCKQISRAPRHSCEYCQEEDTFLAS